MLTLSRLVCPIRIRQTCTNPNRPASTKRFRADRSISPSPDQSNPFRPCQKTEKHYPTSRRQRPFPALPHSPTTPPTDSAPHSPRAPERACRSSSSTDRHAPAIPEESECPSPVPEDASRTSDASYGRSPASLHRSVGPPPSSPAASPSRAGGDAATRPSQRHDTSASPEKPTATPTRARLPTTFAPTRQEARRGLLRRHGRDRGADAPGRDVRSAPDAAREEARSPDPYLPSRPARSIARARNRHPSLGATALRAVEARNRRAAFRSTAWRPIAGEAPPRPRLPTGPLEVSVAATPASLLPASAARCRTRAGNKTPTLNALDSASTRSRVP